MKSHESTVEPTYFTCTLDQAASFNEKHPHEYQTITEFIDTQASTCPQKPAVGFALPATEDKEWSSEIYSFQDLKNGSSIVAQILLRTIKLPSVQDQPCVGLICPSTAEFLFTWLGLMRASFSVLLIAPQCQPDAIAHLCKACDASTLFYDQSYQDLATRASSDALKAEILPWQQDQATSFHQLVSDTSKSSEVQPVYTADAQSVAYIHHTSGTSTGLPKPIPQSHRAGVGVLPCLDGSSTASFTTTPLYHGGVADCFRAWTSSALIWLFYGKIPITSSNIKSALQVADRSFSSSTVNAPVRYFSSVPYILQMLADDTDGLKRLVELDIVGVGGAALPDQVGARLTQSGVHLISRFGSAECGFLLSSHRDYDDDQAWQFLRAPPKSSLLRFEQQSDGSGLSELIILKGWPHMAKVNRDDGSFATSDLFEPHPHIAHAWRYHSRSDSQITLVTGKKFDPAPVEDTITASDPLIRDVMVFGSGRQVPGALIFVSEAAQDMPETEIRDRLWKAVDNVNQKGQDHTRISRDMIVILKEGSLEKSSKGTLLRKPAEEKFAKEIEAAYSGDDDDSTENIASEDVETLVKTVVAQVVDHDLDDDTDFYQNGVDSAKATRMRTLLQKKFGKSKVDLPWNVIYDCGNIKRLSKYIRDKLDKSESSTEDYQEEMLQLVDRFSKFSQNESKSVTKKRGKGSVVLLTGATGSLGAHILDLMSSHSNPPKICCLVRAKSDAEAKQRVLQGITQRKLKFVDDTESVKFLACDLSREDLGLSSGVLTELKEQITHIIHSAWPVNFSLGLQSFATSLQGLQNLVSISLSAINLTTFLFCSSTASVLGPNHPTPIPELVSADASNSDSLGYSRSKWVAESICARASPLLSQNGARMKIARIGQLTGNTSTGVWNMSEAYPLMLSTVYELDCLPRIPDKLDWLPVDEAAQAIIEIANLAQAGGKSSSPEGDDCTIYHVLNDAAAASFTDLLKWLHESTNRQFDIVEPQKWVKALEGLEQHPAKALLGLWNRAYCGEGESDEEQKGPASIVFETRKAKEESLTMKNVQPVSKELGLKIWQWLEKEVNSS